MRTILGLPKLIAIIAGVDVYDVGKSSRSVQSCKSTGGTMSPSGFLFRYSNHSDTPMVQAKVAL